MKKNLTLLGILAALLIGTYYFQEVKTRQNYEEALTKDQLIAADKILQLSFGDVSAVKKDGQWWAGEQLLSHNVLKQIESKIAQIRKIKAVTGEKKNYFSHALNFKVNNEDWALGDMTLDRQGFYLSRGADTMVAVIEGASGELTDDEAKLSQIKYDDLTKALSYSLKDLAETQLFRFYPHLPFGKVTIEAEGRPGYELNLLENKTLPPPIQGIEVHDKLLEKFNSLVTQITLKKEVPYSESLKGSKIGQMVFSKGEDKVVWELWLPSAKSADSYILDNKNKKAFLMVGGTLRVFFIQVLDYWDKKVIPPSKFEHFTRLKTTFIQGEKSAVVEIINREPLGFESPKFKVDDLKMNILFQYVFNLSEKDQADRISQLSKSERKEVLSGDHLRLEVLGQELVFWRKTQELIVVNLTQGFKAHFLVADETFRATFEDVLK